MSGQNLPEPVPAWDALEPFESPLAAHLGLVRYAEAFEANGLLPEEDAFVSDFDLHVDQAFALVREA